MLLDKVSEVLDGLFIEQDLASELVDKHRYWQAPRNGVGDAPVIEVIKFFHDVNVIRGDVFDLILLTSASSLLCLIEILMHFFSVLHVELWSEPGRRELLKAIHFQRQSADTLIHTHTEFGLP